MKTINKIFLLIILALSGCNDEDSIKDPSNIQWKDMGLTGMVINKIMVYDDTIYAATDNGFYKKNLNNTTWTSLGLDNKSCKTFLLFGHDEYMVSVFDPSEPGEAELLKSDNGGNTWLDFQNGFGGESPEPVFDLAVNLSDSSQIYATGYMVVARSDNKGESWHPVYGNWGGFATGLSVVKVNPNDTDQVWSGGQNGIEQAVMLFSPDSGNNWQNWLDLLEAPSVVKLISFDPESKNIVYGGLEGGLIKSDNQGQDWQKLIESDENRFFFGVCVHPDHPEIIYASGWLKDFDNPQPLIIFRSADGGQTWSANQYPEEIYGGVYNMDLVVNDQKDMIYLGLYKGGVYRFDFNRN